MRATLPPPLVAELTPLVLFARLGLAVERGDYVAAAEAQRELSKRGIEVKYGRPAGPKAVPSAR